MLKIKGPLDDKWIREIGLLYGSFSPRYASAVFCQRIFNLNPVGYSFHVFAINDSGDSVGHLGVIPIPIVNNGWRGLCGKGEAFYIQDKYRSAYIQVDGQKTPLGVAMVIELLRFAFSEGVNVYQGVSTKGAGILFRMAGCKKLDWDHLYYHLALNIRKNYYSKFELIMLLLRLPLNRLWRIIIGWRNGFYKNKIISVPGETLSDKYIVELSRHLAVYDPGWHISMDVKTLRWYLQSGLYMLYTTENSKYLSDFMLVRKNINDENEVEIMGWHTSTSSSTDILLNQLLWGVVKDIQKKGAQYLIFRPDWFLRSKGKEIKKSGSGLGFIDQVRQTRLYVKSPENELCQKENITITPFISGIF